METAQRTQGSGFGGPWRQGLTDRPSGAHRDRNPNSPPNLFQPRPELVTGRDREVEPAPSVLLEGLRIEGKKMRGKVPFRHNAAHVPRNAPNDDKGPSPGAPGPSVWIPAAPKGQSIAPLLCGGAAGMSSRHGSDLLPIAHRQATAVPTATRNAHSTGNVRPRCQQALLGNERLAPHRLPPHRDLLAKGRDI